MPRELSSGQKWFRRAVQVLLLAAVLTTLALSWPEPAIEVRTATVGRATVEEIVPSLQAGTVKSHRQVTLRATTLGQIVTLAAKKGDRVRENQILLELNNAVLQARLRLARANLASGESAARSAQLRLDLARKNLERTQRLMEKGATTSQLLERAQAEFDMAAEAVTTAQSALGELRAGVDLALASLEDTRVRAPFDGLVASCLVEKGESVMAGAPLLDLVDDSGITVEATVDEADAGRIKLGMPVRLTTDAFPNQAFSGKLAWISPVVARDLRQNRHLDVEISLDGDAPELRVGLSTDIEIIVQSRPDVLAVPTTAVMRRGERMQVYVVSGDRARLRDVRGGLSNWEKTEILEGLREGERIILSLNEKGLADGVRVKLPGSDGHAKVAY